MKIHGNLEKLNFDKSLQPLFDAMLAGKVITSVVCMGGSANKDDRSADFTITNFVASDYWVAMSSSGDKHFDYVDLFLSDNPRNSFYMNWVLSYQIDGKLIHTSNVANPKNYNCQVREECQYPSCECHNY